MRTSEPLSPSDDLPSYVLPTATTYGSDGQRSGRALVTGKCADMASSSPGHTRFGRTRPYFHNGSAATLLDVVNFYDQRSIWGD